MMNIRRLHPGFYIRESLEAMEMSSREFSIRTGISERTAYQYEDIQERNGAFSSNDRNSG